MKLRDLPKKAKANDVGEWRPSVGALEVHFVIPPAMYAICDAKIQRFGKDHGLPKCPSCRWLKNKHERGAA